MVVAKRNSKLVSTTANRTEDILTYKKQPKLWKADWNAKDAGTNPSIELSNAAKTAPFQPGAKLCNLYLAEKFAVSQSNLITMLNKRVELNSKRRH